ncbi:MAG: HAD hydrolase family protein [Sedimentisphaerales bacterium]|nr:HAD hydrolase family protein [Sedimentisphaerales bacterium]
MSRCSGNQQTPKDTETQTGQKRKFDLADIQLLALDVDGVLTDGKLIINADGSEGKSFNALDGHGIRMWQRAGLKVAFLSGRSCEPTKHRAQELEVDYYFQNCHDKLPILEELLEKSGIQKEAVAYIGDDLPDLPVIRYVGFGVAVANATDEVKRYADYVTSRDGGNGAVREVIEYILKKTGRWQQLMERYLPDHQSV